MGATVAVVGCGGNVGSHLVELLARSPFIQTLILVDKDHYEQRNLESQQISLADVGRAKVEVLEERLKAIRTDLEIRSHACRLEHLPLGAFRADLLVCCLDSRRARVHLNARALALGVPLLDCGVNGQHLGWQVSFFDPTRAGVCLECTWQQADYDLLEDVRSCAGEEATIPTGAPAALGSMTAAYIALKCGEFLAGTLEPRQFFSRQSRMMVGGDILRTIRFEPNPACRAEGHEAWDITRLEEDPGSLSVAASLDLGARPPATSLSVPGHAFRLRLRCAVCEADDFDLRLFIDPDAPLPPCGECGGIRFTTGDDLREELTAEILTPEVRARSLEDIGLRPGEVFQTARGEEVWHFEISGEQPGTEAGMKNGEAHE